MNCWRNGRFYVKSMVVPTCGDKHCHAIPGGSTIPTIPAMASWLVVEPPLWKIWVRQLGLLFPTYGKITNVPNHQPVGVHQVIPIWHASKLPKSLSMIYRESTINYPEIIEHPNDSWIGGGIVDDQWLSLWYYGGPSHFHPFSTTSKPPSDWSVNKCHKGPAPVKGLPVYPISSGNMWE